MDSAFDFLKEILKSRSGSFGFMFSLGLFILWIAVKAGKIIERYKVIEKIEKNIDTIKNDLSQIKAFIELFKQNNNPFAKSKSPISLTELGDRVAEDLKVKRIINKNWSEIEKK